MRDKLVINRYPDGRPYKKPRNDLNEPAIEKKSKHKDALDDSILIGTVLWIIATCDSIDTDVHGILK